MFGLGVQEITILVLLAFFATPSLIAALVHNRFFQQSNPGSLPYRWGYFQAWSSVLGGIFLGAAGFSSFFSNSHGEESLWIILSLFLTSAGLGVMWRKKWGWVLLCILSLSTVIALVVNILYAKNRWKEFSSNRKENIQNNECENIFWIGDTNGERKGPFSYEEMKSQIASGGISRATLVWKEGMANWTEVDKTDLGSFFKLVPPPIPQSTYSKEQPTEAFHRILPPQMDYPISKNTPKKEGSKDDALFKGLGAGCLTAIAIPAAIFVLLMFTLIYDVATKP